MHAVEEFLTETLPLQLENPNGLYELHEAAEASLFDVGDILGEDRDPSLCTVDRSSAAGLVMRALIIEVRMPPAMAGAALRDAPTLGAAASGWRAVLTLSLSLRPNSSSPWISSTHASFWTPPRHGWRCLGSWGSSSRRRRESRPWGA